MPSGWRGKVKNGLPDPKYAAPAGQLADSLLDQVDTVDDALRREGGCGVDYYQLIVQVQRTSDALLQGPVDLQRYLIGTVIQNQTLLKLLTVCNKVDAAHDAMLCFLYPTEDTPTLLGCVGTLLYDIMTTLTGFNAAFGPALNSGSAYFKRVLQHQLAPALTQLASQATAALNTAHDHLRILPAPLASKSLHTLLQGITYLAEVSVNWGAPLQEPRRYSAIVTALARHHTAEAAARLLAALQDPLLVAAPATPATHPALFAQIHILTASLLALTFPYQAMPSPRLHATHALTPAARSTLSTQLLSHHHLLVHLLRTAAACAHAPPTPSPRRSPSTTITNTPLAPVPTPAARPITPIPTPALTPAFRKSFTAAMQYSLQNLAVWLGDDANGPRCTQRWYTTCPEAVWQATGDLLEAITQPRGWRAVGVEALQVVLSGLPLGDLAVQHPELLPSVVPPLVELLRRHTQELMQRRRQLTRPKPVLWHMWMGRNWKGRVAPAATCHRAVVACLGILWVLTEDEADANYNDDPVERSDDDDEEDTPVADLLREPAIMRKLHQALDCMPDLHWPLDPPEDALDVLDRMRALVEVLHPEDMPQPSEYLDVCLWYAMSVMGAVASALLALMLVVLRVWARCSRNAELQQRVDSVTVSPILQVWRASRDTLGDSGALTLRPALLAADACPATAAQALALAAGAWPLRMVWRLGGGAVQ